MITIFRDMTIRRRIFFVVMITTLVALLIGSSFTIYITYRSRLRLLEMDVATLAKVIGDNCKVSLAYKIPEDAVDLLDGLSKRPSIVHAVVHDAECKDFAEYYRGSQQTDFPSHSPNPGAYDRSGSCIEKSYMRVWEPIVFDGKQIGCLHIFDDMSDVRSFMRRDILMLVIFCCFGLIVAFAITQGINSLVSTPIGHLSYVSRKVSSTGDFSLRAKKTTGGEIGGLVDSFNDMLEHTECANRALEALVEELEAKNAELERFTYTVSHDLKSPLITIQGFIAQLKKHCEASDKPKVQRDTARIEEAAQKMNQLLEDLLNLSRVGHVIGELESVKMNKVVDEAMVMLDASIRDSAVEFIVDDMPQVRVDAARMTEVMQNLIDNAIKFMGDQPKPKILVGCRTDGDEDVFFVEDNGIGIEDDYHEKIFGLFEQLNQHISGTGIGLTIVRRIIELHGGRIWIENGKEEVGVRFCFTLWEKKNNTENNDAG